MTAVDPDAGSPEPPSGPDPEARRVVPDVLDPTGELRSVASDCVHCGFCLPACPTYQLWGEEMDSPRGRIHLISQALAGTQLTEAAAGHLDRCLGCMACLPACPSGVRYDRLIEAARTWTEEPPDGLVPAPARTARERAMRAAIFATFPYPRRLRALLGPLRAAQWTRLDRLAGSRAAQRLAPELAVAMRLAPGHAPAARAGALPGRVPAAGERRAVVGMLTGCVQQVFFPEVNAATARVLAAEGCDVIIPAGQGCCGALSLHSGRASQAVRLARRTIAEFERAGVDAIVVNSAGCGSAMKEYGALLADGGGHRGGPPPADASGQPDPAGWPARAAAIAGKVRDFSEFLVELFDSAGGPRAVRHGLAVTAAYHDACHLAHAQRIRQQPRDLLRAIPGLTLAEVGDGGTCCGSAGLYNLLQPEAARELGERKAAAIMATGASLVVSANPGCSLQIASATASAGGDAPAVAHIAEVLDASLRGLPVRALTGSAGAQR
ncbi:MAG TPA: heterodisulfide reductase-related iron-sulfur binding cluster [Streptosporangiaceae bacterium]|nr:heterodisulfide reductase-related iron-sulfur binding cluster [Streptosporangiaceae bacterium]